MNHREFAQMGARAANSKRTKEERSALAKKASKARWKKWRAEQKLLKTNKVK